MNFKTGYLALAIVAVFSLTQCSIMEPEPGLGGTYTVRGTNPDGSSYTGDVKIKPQGGNYQFTWTINGETFTGNGTLNGSTLTVEWAQPAPAIYEVKNDGRLLEGTWANGEGTETLKKVPF